MAPLRGTVVLVAVMLAAGCGGRGGDEVHTTTPTTVTVSSEAFTSGSKLPVRFTCDGDAVSPPLMWSGGSAGGWALVVDDPDAPGGSFVHWAVLDIPAGTTSVETGGVPGGGAQVVNSSGDASYAGPCPPSGEHRYRFTVYALDSPTGLTEKASLDEALDAIADHATARGTLEAVYSRH